MNTMKLIAMIIGGTLLSISQNTLSTGDIHFWNENEHFPLTVEVSYKLPGCHDDTFTVKPGSWQKLERPYLSLKGWCPIDKINLKREDMRGATILAKSLSSLPLTEDIVYIFGDGTVDIRHIRSDAD